jgi:hypothetical protein
MQFENENKSYFRQQSEAGLTEKEEFWTDDEIETVWAESRFDSTTELNFDE